MALSDDFESWMRHQIEQQNMTHHEVSNLLSIEHGSRKGYSVRSIQDFCAKHNIHRHVARTQTTEETNRLVTDAIAEVGPTYGRKMMTGYLRSKGLNIGERRVRQAMISAAPYYQDKRRTNTARQTNPIPYYAEYFGHKLHMDQNEKLGEYGVTHVMASDGYSGKIVGATSMPVKNNILIYDNVYREACLKFGLWDQVRVDHGREFYLVLYQQDKLKDFRRATNRQPYIQSLSKQNHAAERHWVEVNSRVNYPLKSVLNFMKNDDIIDMSDPVTKFCVSTVTMSVCSSAIENMIVAWNAHTIPGKGVPNRLALESMSVKLEDMYWPAGRLLSREYVEHGGEITDFGGFGVDPLSSSPELFQQRDHRFHESFPSLGIVMSQATHGNHTYFMDAILFYLNLTHTLSSN